MDDLIRQAQVMGHRVVLRDLGKRAGEVHSSGIIVINPRKSLLTQRVTLAHELGHVHYGHDWRGRHDRERDEREADTYAAVLLISPADYATAERVVGTHVGALAKELGVTSRLVTLWQARMDGRAVRMSEDVA